MASVDAWLDGLNLAVTVTDAQGTIIAMNRTAVKGFEADGGEALLGHSVFDCHPEPARTQTAELFATQSANHYTIRKRGQKKIIHQMPWYRDGAFAGFVELSVPIPDDLAHFDR